MGETDVVAPTQLTATTNTRFECTLCQSTFARKEHLTRHLKTHDPGTSHVCTICGKKFNRSDSLHRHLNKHGEGLKTSSRSKRACLACHAAKTKCDGEDRCQPCLKKGIECQYRVPDEPSPENGQGNTHVVDDSKLKNLTLNADGGVGGDISSPPVKPLLAAGDGRRIAISPSPHIDWTDVRLQMDVIPKPNLARNPAYMDTYFTHFHHRFPVIHRPSYEDHGKASVQPLLLSSIDMIGAWLYGTVESKDFAVVVHHKMVSQCLVEISTVSSADKFQESFSAAICQAALLNIAFVLFCGKEQAVSRGVMLHTMLVAALREVGFFDANHVWPDQRPGYFFPMAVMRQGERQQLSQCLFRLDTYLSILRGTARLISPQELIYPLAISFALWNAEDLTTWEERLGDRSPYRTNYPASDTIRDLADATQVPSVSVLIEDIQVALCSVHSSIYQFHARVKSQNYSLEGRESTQDALESQLTCLKIRLNQITNGPICADSLRLQYHGYEDFSVPGWQTLIESRVQTLFFDTSILQHFLNIQHFIDPSRLSQVKNELVIDLTQLSKETQGIIGKRRCNTAKWVASTPGRRALCAAVDVLSEFQNLDMNPCVDRHRLDPIAYIATATAALVVWIHSNFGVYACWSCSIAQGFTPTKENVVNLSGVSVGRLSREEWADKLPHSRTTIDGLEMCLCKLDKIIDKYKVFVPESWELANSIAPGIFVPVVSLSSKQQDVEQVPHEDL